MKAGFVGGRGGGKIGLQKYLGRREAYIITEGALARKIIYIFFQSRSINETLRETSGVLSYKLKKINKFFRH